MNLAKTKLVDTIGRYNLKVNNVSKFQFNDTEIEMFCNMMNEYAAEVNGDEQSESNCNLQNVVGSASKSELIVKLIEKIHSESDNKEPLEYHSKMACGYGMVTLDIKIE